MHDTQTIQLVLTAVAAGALALQTIFMIVMTVIAMKAMNTVKKELEEYRSVVIPVAEKMKPIVDRVNTMVNDLAPRIDEIGTQVTAMSKSLREQTAELQLATHEIIDRTRKQANRVDGITTSVLNRVERAGEVMSDAVVKPMRQLSGIIASVKAAVDALREEPAPAPPAPQAPRVVSTRFSDGEPLGPRPTGTATPFRP